MKSDRVMVPAKFNLYVRLQAEAQALADKLGVAVGAVYLAGTCLLLEQITSHEELMPILEDASHKYLSPVSTGNDTRPAHAVPAGKSETKQISLKELLLQ